MEPIVIVGGGIIGASVAYHLRDHPRPVVLYERDALGSGSSADSVALFVWHQSTPNRRSHDLRARSWELYEPQVADGTFSFDQIGTLDVASTADGATGLRTATRTLDDWGIDAQFLDPDALAAHGLDPDEAAGAMWTPEDGYLDPAEIIQYYVQEAVAAGATVETQTPVTDVVTDGDAVVGVETSEGVQPAAAVVNAAGPWAPRLNDLAGVSYPLRHNRGPVVVLQADHPFSLPFLQFDDADLYFRGEGATQAFAGCFGTSYDDADRLEPAGAYAVPHRFYLSVQSQIEDAIPRLEGVELVNEWVGIRTLTPDGVPIVGESDVDGFFVANGMNGLGVTLAPAVAEFLATRLLGEDVDPALEAYLSPARFS